MTVETASYISQLVATNPTASDPKSQGDNHIRMVKTVLQTQFPNLGAVAVTPTATQINNFIANGGIYSVGTSVTSLTVGAGSQTFTTQTGRGFAIGQSIKITSDADVNTFMTGVCTAYDTTTGAMSVLVYGVSGSGTSALWSISVFIDSGSADLIRSARTSNTILGTADKGTLIDITSGTFSQTFDAAATLGDGWWCYLRNSGTGVITLDPNAAETMDGVATKAIDPLQAVIVQCDGAALRTIALSGVGNHSITVHTGNGHGSTNTKVRRFTTTQTSVGTAITYSDSATLGASFTINEPGLYAISFIDAVGSQTAAISLNASGTTDAYSLAASNVLARTVGTTGARVTLFSLERLVAGDVVRPHTDGSAVTNDFMNRFSVRKVGL